MTKKENKDVVRMKAKEVTVVLEREISPIVESARGLEIVDADGMGVGVEMLSRLNQFNDRVVEEKEKITKPLNEALKVERARWKPIETVVLEAIAVVRGKMSQYQTAEVLRAREEEKRIAERVGEGKGKFKVETAVRKLGEIEVAEEKVVSGSGMVKFREDKVLVVVDEKLIPREYLVVDEKAVRGALLEGKKVPGAVLEVKMVPLNFR